MHGTETELLTRCCSFVMKFVNSDKVEQQKLLNLDYNVNLIPCVNNTLEVTTIKLKKHNRDIQYSTLQCFQYLGGSRVAQAV